MKRLALPNLAAMSRRERLLAFGSVLVVGIVLLDRLVLAPWSAHTRKVGDEIRRLEETLRSQEMLLSRRPQIDAQAEPYHEYMRLGTTNALDQATLIKDIEEMGRTSGILLSGMKPLPSSTSDQYDEYAFEVQCQGSLRQWIHFLYQLEASTSLFLIDRTAAAKTDDSSDLLQGTIRVSSRVAHGRPAL